MVILDTNIIIDHLRSSAEKSKLLKLFEEKNDANFAISLITLQELYEGKSTKDSVKEEKLLATLSWLQILPYSYEIAKKAGEIVRDFSPNMSFADAAIAATTMIAGGQLYTLNLKDFEGIPSLELFKN
jgi:predicted nucleic acid-binding protein